MVQEGKELDWSVIESEVRRLWEMEWEKWKVIICKRELMYGRGEYVKTREGIHGNKTY